MSDGGPIQTTDTRRVVLGFQDAEDMGAPDLPTEPVPLNMGPSHPAMHGTVRMVLEVEGERISSADIQGRSRAVPVIGSSLRSR